MSAASKACLPGEGVLVGEFIEFAYVISQICTSIRMRPNTHTAQADTDDTQGVDKSLTYAHVS
jgi:hypothetical protein